MFLENIVAEVLEGQDTGVVVGSRRDGERYNPTTFDSHGWWQTASCRIMLRGKDNKEGRLDFVKQWTGLSLNKMWRESEHYVA